MRIPERRRSEDDRSRSSSRLLRALAGLALMGFVAGGCAGTDGTGHRKEADDESTSDSSSQIPSSKREAAQRTNNGKADWSVDVCQRNGWYGDKACDWFCPDTDPDCDLEPLGPKPSGRPAKHPIVLHHGFMGADSGLWSFHEVADALRRDGHTVYESEVPPFHGVEARAETLATQIDDLLDRTGAARVNLVAHSMGGIDARYLVSESGLDYGDRVASVSTVASPHRGTRIADAYLGLVPGFADEAADAVAELVGRQFNDEGNEADLRAAMRDLSTEGMKRFNATHPNAPGVFYQSWAGVSSVAGVRVDGLERACRGKLLMHEGTMDHMDGLLWTAAAITGGGTAMEINDGMATPRSAQWGDFRGCIPADHLDQVGQVDDDGLNENTGFDHVRFYRNLSYGLARRGL